MLQPLLTGEELRSLRLAISRYRDKPPTIPAEHENKLRRLGLVREQLNGLCPTEKGWMALGRHGLA